MRVAVTGAAGFTGRFVAEALAQRGVECVPLIADLADYNALRAEIEQTPFDRVIHLAARAFVDMADWEAFYRVNQLGTLHLLEAISHYRQGTRCILASSAQVYGPGSEGLVGENAPTNPTGHYAISKMAMEQGASLYNDRLDIVVTRPFNYTGVGQPTDYLVPKIVDHFRRRAPVVELGNLFIRRDFGDVRSVADAYTGLVLAKDPPSLVNIATGIVHSIDEIIAILTDMSGHHIDVRVNPRFVRANDVAVLGGDTSRLESALPQWSPYQLPETLAWMYEHGADG